jgi:hypothetical protein
MAYVLIELFFPTPVSHIPREIEEEVLRQARDDQSTLHPPFFDLGHYTEHLWQVRTASQKLCPNQSFSHQVALPFRGS